MLATERHKERKRSAAQTKAPMIQEKERVPVAQEKAPAAQEKEPVAQEKSTGSAGSGASKDGRKAISLVYRSVKLSCKHAGGSQELAPRVIAMVRDVQQLEHKTILELLAATETYLQQVQSTRLSLQTIMEEWTAQASQIQRDELENVVAHVLPKMLDEARASTQS